MASSSAAPPSTPGRAFANGVQPYISGEVGHWSLGTSDAFYGIHGRTAAVWRTPPAFRYKDYTTWNVGFGWTWKVFTVDLRYVDTNLNKGDCNAFTSDHTATCHRDRHHCRSIRRLGSNWCGGRFVARLSADLTVNTNLK